MYYELYIDVFFLENFMMDSLLLLILNRVLNCGRSYARILLGGILGSLLTCLVVAVSFPPVVRSILFHTVVNSAMLCAGLGFTRLSQFVKAFLMLYAAAAVLGGLMQMFRPYMRYVSLFYAAAAVSYVIFLRLWKFFAHIQRREKGIMKVTLFANEREISVTALLDTGNELRDCYTGEPVNVISPEAAAKISDHIELEKGFRLIPCRSVNGESVMKVFRVKKMCIHMEEDSVNEERWIEAPLLGVGEQSLSGNNEYEMILNPAVFSG